MSSHSKKQSSSTNSNSCNTASKSNSKTKSSSKAGKKHHQQQSPIIEITGCTQANETEVKDAIKQKVTNPITIRESYWDDGSLFLKLNSAAQAYSTTKITNLRISGQKISIKLFFPNTSSKSTIDISEILMKLIKSRYNPTLKFLNLDNLIDETEFKLTKLSFSSYKFGPLLCKLIKDSCQDIVTISMAANKIEELRFLSTMPGRLPLLENLSFKNNLIKSYGDIAHFKADEFKKLRELILEGNPLRIKELSKGSGSKDLNERIKKIFPSLNLLDGEVLQEEIEFGLLGSKAMPKIYIGFYDSAITLATTQGFLQKYFEDFDSNRLSLANFYEASSVFSLFISMKNKQVSSLFKDWVKYNRNLNRVRTTSSRMKTIYIGSESIMNVFKDLPSTKHPLKSAPEDKKFLYDSYQQDGCLYIFVHVSETKQRSFNRIFILVPALPGSRAALAGLPCSVINDSLTLRPFNGNNTWKKAIEPSMKLESQSQVPVQVPVQVQSQVQGQGQVQVQVQCQSNLPDQQTLSQYKLGNGLDDAQHSRVVQFAQITGLNYAFGLQCLRETNWVDAAAMEAFLKAKAHIPAAGFII